MTTNHEHYDARKIENAVWAACDTFRGAVDPTNYKNYALTMLFLKYLSDVTHERRADLLRKYGGDEARVARALRNEPFQVPEQADFRYLYANRDADNVGELIEIGLAALEDANKAKLENVFRNVDYNSEAELGPTKERNARLKTLLTDFNKIDLSPSHLVSADTIGDAYEFLIERFASGAGKKAGEFYTPPPVSRLVAAIAKPEAGQTIYDPTCGSGSLLIRVAQAIPANSATGIRDFHLFGQEMNGATWALCKMNMFLHQVAASTIERGDTLGSPKFVDESERTGKTVLKKFDIVVANPPFSLDKWGQKAAEKDKFGRFSRGLPPKSRGDYAFISHMIESAVEGTGRVVVIVPHGVLFRGAAEGRIRRALIEENLLDAVIGLPPNLFYGTGIPVAILVFDKSRSAKGKTGVLFVDASREYGEANTRNVLRDSDIDHIVRTYDAYGDVPKYAHVATRQELEENEFNLNIARYINTFEEEKPICVEKLQAEIQQLETKLTETRLELAKYVKELTDA